MLLWDAFDAPCHGGLGTRLSGGPLHHGDTAIDTPPEVGNISHLSSVVTEPLLPTSPSPAERCSCDDDDDDDEILTPLPSNYSAAEKADALWRVQLRDPLISTPTRQTERATGAAHCANGSAQRTRTPAAPVAAAVERLFADAVVRCSTRHATSALANIAKAQEELAMCTFSPRTNKSTSTHHLSGPPASLGGGHSKDDATNASEACRVSKGDALYQQHAVKVARLAAAVRQKQSDIDARAASPFLSHHASTLRRHVADDTHEWDRKRRERLASMRHMKDEVEKAACHGTPRICERSRELDQKLRTRWSVVEQHATRDWVGPVIPQDDDEVLSCVSGSTTFCTPSATPPRQEFTSSFGMGHACPPAAIMPSPHQNSPASSQPRSHHSPSRTSSKAARCQSLYHRGVAKQLEHSAAVRRADSIAAALSDVRRHVVGATHNRAACGSPIRAAPLSPTIINLSQPIDVHQRLYQDSEASRLRELWSAASTRRSPAKTSSPARRKSTHAAVNPATITTTTPVPGDDEVVVVYEL
jgi:hypothetical protein